MRRILAICILVVAVVGALPLTRAPRPAPNILIVTLDTLRADYAGRGRGTPAIEAFLEEATHFTAARTTVPLTLPAHVSLFSGLHPARHGVHDNATPCREGDYPMLAEQLSERGYATAAFVASRVLSPETGVDAGFELYDCPEAGNPLLGDRGYLQAEVRLRRALSWLWSAPRDRPWMAWVHLYDPHAPYERWEGDRRRVGTPASPNLRDLYAAEVRRVDAAVEKLLAAAGPDTIVVLVSDHGEGLGEHGESAHGMLCYATCVDIFLAVRGPGLRRGAVDPGARSIMDVASTLRKWCGVPREGEQGLPLDGAPHDVVVTETLRAWRVHNLGQCFAAFDGRYTLLESGRSLVLHDRAVDPGEKRALEPAGHAAFPRLDRAARQMRAGAERAIEAPALLETVGPYNSLRRPSVLYLGSAENAKLEDPRTHIDLLEELEAMHPDIRRSTRARDVTALRRFAARSLDLADVLPASPLPHECRATAASGLASITKRAEYWLVAASAAIRAVELGHDSWEMLEVALEYAVRSGAADPVARVVELALSRGSRVPQELRERCLRAVAKLDGRQGRLLRERLS